MSVEQAIQILAQATENLAATRSQHAQISQALMTLQALAAQIKAQMTGPKEVPKVEEKLNAKSGK